MRSRTVAIVAVLAGALGVPTGVLIERAREGGAAATGRASDASVTVARVGDRLPDLSLPGPDGDTHRLAELAQGRPLLVNFWASWCGPCIGEMPALDAFAAQQGANGVQVVGIAIDDGDAVRAFLRARPVRYRVLVDAPTADDASVRLGDERGVLPYSVLVAADGRILRQHAGPLEAADLRAWAADARPTRD